MPLDPTSPATIPELLAKLAPLFGLERPEAMLADAPRLLAQLTGADAAAIVIGRGKRVAAEGSWGDEEGIRAARHGALRALPESSPASRSSDVYGDAFASASVRVLPFGVKDRVFGAVGLRRAATAPDDASAKLVIEMLATRWAAHADIQDIRAAKTQQDRWFNVLDTQLRVLDRERQKFVAVVGQSDTYMLVVAHDGKVPWWNHAIATRLAPEEQRRGHELTFVEVCARLGVAAPAHGSATCPIARTFESNVVIHEEYQTSSSDARRNFFVKFLPIKGPDGRPAEILVIIHDLTDLEILRRSEARYRHLFELSPDGLLMVEPGSTRIVLSNPVAVKLLGWSAQELAELTLEALHEPADWARFRPELENVLAGADPFVRECNILTKSGHLLPANVSVARFDLDDRPVLLIEMRDVSTTKRLEAELRHSQKMEAVGRLAGGVAHDFNNLLSVILGKSELLANEMAPDGRERETLETIRKSALRGSLLTRRLLAFSRKEVVNREAVDLGEIVKEIEALFGNLLGERTALVTEIETPAHVRVDRGQIEQVLMNLVMNARDAMPEGGTIKVRVRREDRPGRGPTTRQKLAGPTGPAVVLEVHDEGIGMDPAMQSRVFEPFFTTKPRGEGTGLGLSTVYGIVKESEGGIEVESRPGQGTTFRLRFLRADIVPKATSTNERAGERAAAVHGRRILLVEDQADVRQMTAEALALSGYSVTEAASGETALEILARDPAGFDLLLTDVVMPGISGGELAQRVRKDRPATRVLYMSGYNDDGIVHRGVSVSEASFLQKPFTLDALARKVREILESGPPAPSPSTGGSAPACLSAHSSSSTTLRP